jgi:hypothetical protein
MFIGDAGDVYGGGDDDDENDDDDDDDGHGDNSTGQGGGVTPGQTSTPLRGMAALNAANAQAAKSNQTTLPAPKQGFFSRLFGSSSTSSADVPSSPPTNGPPASPLQSGGTSPDSQTPSPLTKAPSVRSQIPGQIASNPMLGIKRDPSLRSNDLVPSPVSRANNDQPFIVPKVRASRLRCSSLCGCASSFAMCLVYICIIILDGGGRARG